MFPSDAKERKDAPVFSGCFAYFPNALWEVAKLSKRGNDQHNPGTPLHWDRSKSQDELDALARHLLGTAKAESIDEEIEEATAVTWRALANLQKLCEKRDAENAMIGGAPGTSEEDFKTMWQPPTEAQVNEYIESLNRDGRG